MWKASVLTLCLSLALSADQLKRPHVPIASSVSDEPTSLTNVESVSSIDCSKERHGSSRPQTQNPDSSQSAHPPKRQRRHDNIASTVVLQQKKENLYLSCLINQMSQGSVQRWEQQLKDYIALVGSLSADVFQLLIRYANRTQYPNDYLGPMLRCSSDSIEVLTPLLRENLRECIRANNFSRMNIIIHYFKTRPDLIPVELTDCFVLWIQTGQVSLAMHFLYASKTTMQLLLNQVCIFLHNSIQDENYLRFDALLSAVTFLKPTVEFFKPLLHRVLEKSPTNANRTRLLVAIVKAMLLLFLHDQSETIKLVHFVSDLGGRPYALVWNKLKSRQWTISDQQAHCIAESLKEVLFTRDRITKITNFLRIMAKTEERERYWYSLIAAVFSDDDLMVSAHFWELLDPTETT